MEKLAGLEEKKESGMRKLIDIVKFYVDNHIIFKNIIIFVFIPDYYILIL